MYLVKQVILQCPYRAYIGSFTKFRHFSVPHNAINDVKELAGTKRLETGPR